MRCAPNLARPVFRALPAPARSQIRRIFARCSDLARWPFKSGLDRDFTQLEWRKQEQNLAELQGFPELDLSAWKDLGSLGYEMVRRYRPKVVVELGTHVGL